LVVLFKKNQTEKANDPMHDPMNSADVLIFISTLLEIVVKFSNGSQ
jgi:hypothetical protein